LRLAGQKNKFAKISPAHPAWGILFATFILLKFTSMSDQSSLEYARQLDAQDSLRSFRDQYLFPQHQGQNCLYFCGNSLGLQPVQARTCLETELERWQTLGVEGHFKGELPWMRYHKGLAPQSAHIVGAQEDEVIVMNTLTVNLHLLMVSFYRPQGTRFKIIMEAGAFPSDQYAIESQVRWHGYDPAEAIVEVAPRPGEFLLHTEDILAAIAEHGAQTALVLFAGLNYYTGQVFDLPAITEAGHRAGAYVGFDLAHAAGNVLLHLHDWEVDFAVWCTYKYINSGPGALSGAFIHAKHAYNKSLPRFAGWYGHNEQRRFLMEKGFDPVPGAEGWQLSNAPIFAFAPMKASHDLFFAATMPALRAKSEKLTGYLEFLIDDVNRNESRFRIITPRDSAQRGAQLSLLTGPGGKDLFKYLQDNGVMCDWREHNLPGEKAGQAGVIRLAPTPMYNSFEDVWRLVDLLR
jgi:kynureninase